jgi:hypothetical protein
MSHFNADNIESLTVTAINAASYLDACDEGAKTVRLDAGYYQACGRVLREIFVLLDPHLNFPILLEHSPAARDVAESLKISRRIEISRRGYFPELATVLHRAAI